MDPTASNALFVEKLAQSWRNFCEEFFLRYGDLLVTLNA
jgi:hypothetical protein